MNTAWVCTHDKMNRLIFLFILWAICGAVSTSDEDQGDEFLKSFNADNIFEGRETGLASNPMSAAILNVDKNQYPDFFDTIVSSSIDSLQRQSAPRKSVFDASNFGFEPIPSHGYPYKLAKLQIQPQQPNTHLVPNTQQLSPLRYDIRTVHDLNYKVYKPEENEEGKEILEALKQNPDVASYFKPTVNSPVNYQREDLIENFDGSQNYKNNPYISGPARIRRYTGRRSKENLRAAEDDDDPYNYKSEYISRPKEFDESPYSSPYKKKKEAKDDYEYPYSYDSGYDHKEYDRIKDLSEKQAAEIKQNPGNCKEVKKDGMSCMQCKDPKTGGNYESCSYVAEPKNNKYAYSKENKFDSNDEPDEPEDEQKTVEPKSEKIKDDTAPQKFSNTGNEKPYSSYKELAPKDDSDEKYKAYYIHSSQPKSSEKLRSASDEENSEEDKAKAYDYKKAIPGFYTDNEPKKDVENVLAEFKKKDRSACKKVQKKSMTCYQCVDKSGLKNEECMFVSESAPKKSHVAYQELKEFTSKPATLESNEQSESQIVTTSSPLVQKSAAYTASNDHSKKLKRKKAPAVAPAPKSQKVKRSDGSQIKPEDEADLAAPEEFAGVASQGAFWAETVPRYSATLGVTLPEYMLSRSEHEDSFDEAVAGA